MITTSVAFLHILQRGAEFVITQTGLVEQREGGDAAPTVGASILVFWGRLKRRVVSSMEDHHLNQWAAFEPAFRKAGYKRNEGAMMQLEALHEGGKRTGGSTSSSTTSLKAPLGACETSRC